MHTVLFVLLQYYPQGGDVNYYLNELLNFTYLEAYSFGLMAFAYFMVIYGFCHAYWEEDENQKRPTVFLFVVLAFVFVIPATQFMRWSVHPWIPLLKQVTNVSIASMISILVFPLIQVVYEKISRKLQNQLSVSLPSKMQAFIFIFIFIVIVF